MSKAIDKILSDKIVSKPAAIGIGLLIFLIIAGILYFVGKLLFKRPEDVKAEKEISSDAKSEGLDPGKVTTDARLIYQAFGLDSPLWSWTEDEEAVIRIVQRRYTSQSYYVLEAAYLELYGRDLTNDIYTYFRESQLEQIRNIIE